VCGTALIQERKPSATPAETDPPWRDASPAAAHEASKKKPYLPHAGSGAMACLAWAAGTPVMLISGFSHPTNEFATTYRVINWHACNGCWNDARQRFDRKGHPWRPRHAGRAPQAERTPLITTEQVIATLNRIPGLVERAMADAPRPNPAVETAKEVRS